MIRNILCKSQVNKLSQVRYLSRSIPKYNNKANVFGDREKAAEEVWARQTNEHELSKLYERLIEQQRILLETKQKIEELKISLSKKTH